MQHLKLALLAGTFCSVLPGQTSSVESHHKAVPWETCDPPGEGDPNDDCHPAGDPKPLEYWISLQGWATNAYKLTAQQLPYYRTVLTEVGKLGTARICSVKLLFEGELNGEAIVAERRPGQFIQLATLGILPSEPEIVETSGTKVLTVIAQYSGPSIIRSVSQLAWVWMADGPVLISIQGPMKMAIDKVAGGSNWLSNGLDFRTLSAETPTWKEWHNQGVRIVNTKYALRNGKLVPIWAQSVDRFDEHAPVITWP